VLSSVPFVVTQNLPEMFSPTAALLLSLSTIEAENRLLPDPSLSTYISKPDSLVIVTLSLSMEKFARTVSAVKFHWSVALNLNWLSQSSGVTLLQSKLSTVNSFVT